jgi:predicted TIM-barrel fold metal-dependent hydrolase
MAPSAPNDAPLVDSHFHVYTTDMPLTATAWHKPPADATTEQLIETLDTHGVTFGVIAAASLYGDYNDYSLRALRQHRRLRATAIVRPTIDLHELEALDREGFCGIRFQFRNVKQPPDVAAPEYRALLRRIRDLDWHVHLNDDGARLPGPLRALRDAGVKIVIDHFGYPDESLGGVNSPGFRDTLAAIEGGRTWVKLSAGYRMSSAENTKRYAAELVKFAGGERLLWGSDWPFANFETKVTYAQTVANLRAWVPDETMRRQIGGDTPLKLYFARL